MAVGKNKRLSKGKKGNKKKIVDPFSKKDWYDVKVPSNFNVRNIGKTPVSRTVGTKIASEGLKGRVFEMAQADLNNDEVAFRKFRLIAEDVQGRNVLTNFHGMSMTTDKIRSLVKKWQTCIEAHTDVKTTDGYLLRFFAIGFTARCSESNKKTAYAKSTKVRAIRRRMNGVISREVRTKDLKDVVTKLLPDSMSSDIIKACFKVFPLSECYIRKVKVLKKPKFDARKLMEMHEGSSSNTTAAATASADPSEPVAAGVSVDRPDNYEPPVLESV